jgi:hypothetical protein
MTTDETQLYSRIEAFAFDDGTPEMSFAARLAKDNGWRTIYALRVIEEYRRFAFLMMVSGHMAVPSDQVDQAWHQHLQYTRSWAGFCTNVLRQTLHHEATRGGNAETDRFKGSYEQTLQSYRRFFGAPPDDIWPSADLRFGRDLHYRRVNTRHNFVIPKLRLQQFGVVTAAVLSAILLAWMS